MNASRKQKAFLSFLGFPNANEMGRKEATELISKLSSCGGTIEETYQHLCWIWYTEKLLLHPNLYAADLKSRLSSISETFHRYVRSRISGASERLTKQRIDEVIESLNAEKQGWWNCGQCDEIMFERLKILFPGCCDGTISKPISRDEALDVEKPTSQIQPRPSLPIAQILAGSFEASDSPPERYSRMDTGPVGHVPANPKQSVPLPHRATIPIVTNASSHEPNTASAQRNLVLSIGIAVLVVVVGLLIYMMSR